MINLDEVGAHVAPDGSGHWRVNFGIYLPGMTFKKGYRLKARVIHEADQFIRGIEPKDFWMSWDERSALDLWTAEIALTPDGAPSHFGQNGNYLYRFQLLRTDGREIAFWVSDPFARATGLGTLSAFTIDNNLEAFAWTDAAFSPPEIDEMVVYEVNVREFNNDFDGLIAQLDYIRELGVNVLELLPVNNVKEIAERGYTPLNYFGKDEGGGGPDGMNRLVKTAPGAGRAGVGGAVYPPTQPGLTCKLVTSASVVQTA